MEDLFGPGPTVSQESADTVVAIFDFDAQEASDLGFKKGEKIEVLKRDGDWWTGRIGSREGTFPYNYVKKPETMDSSDPLAEAFKASPSSEDLIKKVTASSDPVDLQKILGNNEESVLEKEVRLQNERIAGAAGIGEFSTSDLVSSEKFDSKPDPTLETTSQKVFTATTESGISSNDIFPSSTLSPSGNSIMFAENQPQTAFEPLSNMSDFGEVSQTPVQTIKSQETMSVSPSTILSPSVTKTSTPSVSPQVNKTTDNINQPQSNIAKPKQLAVKPSKPSLPVQALPVGVDSMVSNPTNSSQLTATESKPVQKVTSNDDQPSGNGTVTTQTKPKKIADELGLEFDDGGSTKIVSFEANPKEYVEMVVNSLPSRVFIAIIVITDIILTIMDLAKPEKTMADQAAFDWISFLIGFVFIFDVGGRMFAYGFERYFSDPWEAADFGIVCVTFSVSVAMLAIDKDADQMGIGNWLKVVTFLRVLRIFRLVRLISSGTGAARQQVGQNKRRYQKDGFDLDLTYITDQCIAMSFPSEGRTAMFRNPMTEVSRFMKTKHPGHYFVWNLCAERGYESKWFENSCGRLLVDDHNVPKLKELVDWAEKVKEYTEKDKQNVLVVHCKGGKGRTGTCIATWMLATDFLKTADLALRHFGERRTDDKKGKAFQGVETPSQSRYVNYYEKIKYSGWPVVRKVQIKAFTIQNISPIGRGNGSCIFFKIYNYGKEVFYGSVADQHNVTCAVDRQLDRATIHLKTPLVVKDDIKFMFYSSEKSVPRNYEDCGFYFWLHTGFFPASGNLTLERHELDNPHKSKTWDTFTDGFSCTVHSQILTQ